MDFLKGEHVQYHGSGRPVNSATIGTITRTEYGVYDSTRTEYGVYDSKTLVYVEFFGEDFEYGCWAINLTKITKEKFATIIAMEALGLVENV